MKKVVALLPWIAYAACIGPYAAAQDYPNKTIRFVVPFSAGSAVDIRARQVADLLGPRLKQSVIVENRVGASGALGAQVVAKSKPDGYTFLFCTGGTHGVNSALNPELGYDPERDFVPVVRVVTAPMVLATNPKNVPQSVGALIQLAKSKPGQLRYGSAGNASPHHLAAELFSRRAGIELLHVPYKGDGPAVTDVIAGHIDMLFAAPLVLLPQAEGGRLKLLGTTGTHRAPAMRDVPTLKDAGIANAEFTVWSGVCAPANTPKSIVTKMNQEILAVILAPEVKNEMVRQGYEVEAQSSEEFAAFIAEDIVRAKKLVQELNIQPGQ